jgi:hypothetical protein
MDTYELEGGPLPMVCAFVADRAREYDEMMRGGWRDNRTRPMQMVPILSARRMCTMEYRRRLWSMARRATSCNGVSRNPGRRSQHKLRARSRYLSVRGFASSNANTSSCFA